MPRGCIIMAMVIIVAVFFVSRMHLGIEVRAEERCVLSVSKEVDKAGANTGSVLTYTLNFSNMGNADCTGGGVKVWDTMPDNLAFVEETHSDNVSGGYGSLNVFDEASRTLNWNAHELNPGESGWIEWKAAVSAPQNCGDFSVFNEAAITSWEYSEFNEIVNSNMVRTDISNACPPANETTIHFLKKTCPSWSVLAGNADADIYDDTNGRYAQFVNFSQDLPHFPAAYLAEPVAPNEIPASCTAQSGWSFKLSTDREQEQNTTITASTNASGEAAIKLSELSQAQEDALNAGSRLWVSEIMQSSQDFGALRCYKDAEFGDNLEYIQFSAGDEPEDVYCIAYNVMLPVPELEIVLVKAAEPQNLPSWGGTVDYSYSASNQGDAPLSDITLSDDKCQNVIFMGGDANSDQKLDVNEIWNYYCQANLIETTLNTATITGKYGDRSVSATASAQVTVAPFNAAPAMNLVKTANPTSLSVGGGNVIYTYAITNPGNVPLSNIGLSDDKCLSVSYASGDENSDNKLDPIEMWTYGCQANLIVTTTNMATASATYESATLTKTAQAIVTVAQQVPAPAIHVSKSANPASLPVGGGNVSYAYDVTNPGNVALADVALLDDKCGGVIFTGGDANSDQKLDENETWKYSCASTISATTANIATVTGRVGDQTVKNTATATVTVATGGGCTNCGSVLVSEAIKVTKTPVPDSVPVGGAEVIYKYIVSNTGSSQLRDMSLVDDKCADIKFLGGDSNNDKWLQAGELWNYECKMKISMETVNTATATGYAGSSKVTSTATAKVTMGAAGGPTIKVVKKSDPERLGPNGGNVKYLYDISNPGRNPLHDVSISDDKCNPIVFKGGDLNVDSQLDYTEIWRYECEASISKTITNFATARGRVGSVYATDTTSATVIVGQPIIPVTMPKTGGGAAATEEGKTARALILFVAVALGSLVIRAIRKKKKSA